MNRTTETATVKAALRNAGIHFHKVCHGTGTARSWIEVYLAAGTPYAECERAYPIIRAATGRERWWNDNILVFSPNDREGE